MANGSTSTARSTRLARRSTYCCARTAVTPLRGASSKRAINLRGAPQKVTIDKSGAKTAAIESIRADAGADIEMRQSKYLNNLIEQDHRAVKRIVRLMPGFKNFRCARA